MAETLQVISVGLIGIGFVLAFAGFIMLFTDSDADIITGSTFAIAVLLLAAGFGGFIFGEPSCKEYNADEYDWTKIEADKVEIRIDTNGGKERVVEYTFGNYKNFVHYVTPTSAPTAINT